ncbi:fumarylacetoacetate hydrolase family protein [Talaromyces proteolyticus]|uniref:Fumarylacetoacetate hydrolase family protein n=1 Tax=Talaromyces proteolyticus TaxID=1131652 RepID=A0AAD4Q323_9EURO|nr:fumarylacetoacetate hydrolase family protein [Talaromyces proteolyticus]KAH8700987.1 fumarylacetoacetate hydrolase family protein [Talaromyces proteolyticus]
MKPFSRLIRFESGGETFFADLSTTSEIPPAGSSITAYRTYDDLTNTQNPVEVAFGKLLAPLPRADLPIYCVGLNYRSHAKEAKLNIPMNPPVWTKPPAALASAEEDIRMSRYCASNFPDWEGELVFVTSRECRDISIDEAEACILGYTVGNDLSCRFFQLPAQNGGQFYYAKAFDKFAPIGPVLVSPEQFNSGKKTKLTTRVNGQVMQNVEIQKDRIFSPAQVLSFMSQSTTIPAYTAVMTGTPAGVGAFMTPKRFLRQNEVVEVEIDGIGILRNKIVFPDGQDSLL